LHLAKTNDRDLDFLRVLMEEEKLKPVIEKCYQLDQIIQAHRHVEGGRTKGKIVIEIKRE